MSQAGRGQPNASARNSRNEKTNGRVVSARSKSVSDARHDRRQRNDTQMTHTERNSLEEYGYIFKNGKLVSIENNGPFEFNVYPNKEDNQRRYHSIGRLIDMYVYQLLERECQLQPVPVPMNAKNSEPTGFFFVSEDIMEAKYILIIIHGMGVVRAGQWSRSIIINDGLEYGSQINYIKRAQEAGYAVIVTNTNLNTDESSRSVFNAARPIRGSGSAEEHGCYIWENIILRSQSQRICIMAHSYGGAVVVALASRYTNEFEKRVFAVALTDSPMKAYTKHIDKNVLRILQKKTINWIADDRHPADTDLKLLRDYGRLRAAGHSEHGWTSYTAFDGIFRFFEEERRKK